MHYLQDIFNQHAPQKNITRRSIMEFLNEYMLPVVLGICLCVGYMVKQWVGDVNNRFIPTIVATLGVMLSVWISGWEISPEIILSGLISGLGSTGMHQMFKQFIEGKNTF